MILAGWLVHCRGSFILVWMNHNVKEDSCSIYNASTSLSY